MYRWSSSLSDAAATLTLFVARLAMSSHSLCSRTRRGQHWLCLAVEVSLSRMQMVGICRSEVTENGAGAYVSDEEG